MKMTRPRTGRATAAILALLASTAVLRAEDRRLRALDGALAGVESGGPAAAAPLVAELERQDAARRREFAAMQGRRLPAKALERLARTREAYESGQGRLLALLHQLGGAPTAMTALPFSILSN